MNRLNAAPDIIGGYHNGQKQHEACHHELDHEELLPEDATSVAGKRGQARDSQHGQMAASITTAVAPCLMPCLQFALRFIPTFLDNTHASPALTFLKHHHGHCSWQHKPTTR